MKRVKQWINKKREQIRRKNLSPSNNRKRVGVILFGTTLVLFSVFIVRFSYIVVAGKIGDESLGTKSAQLYQGSSVVKAKRGSILDRNGDPIAEDATSYSLFVIITHDYFDYVETDTGTQKRSLYLKSENDDKVAAVLEKYLKLDPAVFKKKVAEGRKDGLYQVEFGNAGKGISLETKNNIEKTLEKEKIYGVQFNEHPARIYPNGTYASHLVGYAQLADKENEDKGLTGVMGIEQAYNDVLSGKDGKITYKRDSNGNRVPDSIVTEKETVDGEDIYLTLDSKLQLTLEDLMTQAENEYQPEEMTATLLDAKTGELLAASQRPTFNPETKEGLDDNAVWQNLLVEDAFEPGSTMKVMTLAAAIESGVYHPNNVFESSQLKMQDAVINDWKPMGVIPYSEALPRSSNIGMVHLEQAMGDRWQDYLKKFGFGQTTKSGLNAENPGGMSDSTNEVSRANTAFGQGISVTVFQMLQAFTAIANDGKMLKPQYVSKITNEAGKTVKKTKPDVVSKPISADTAKEVRENMQDTVDKDYGTGHQVYNIDGQSVAAKTGTAEIPSESGGYEQGGTYNYVFSVVQMVPTDDPKYIMYVTMKRPKRTDIETSAAKMMATVSNGMLKKALEVDEAKAKQAKTKKTEDKSFKVGNYVDQNVETIRSEMEEKNLDVTILGTGGTVTKQSSKPGEELMPHQKLILLTDGDISMPDMTSWSKSDVLKLSEVVGAKVEVTGKGYVKSQNIAPGDPISANTKIKIKLEKQPN